MGTINQLCRRLLCCMAQQLDDRSSPSASSSLLRHAAAAPCALAVPASVTILTWAPTLINIREMSMGIADILVGNNEPALVDTLTPQIMLATCYVEIYIYIYMHIQIHVHTSVYRYICI